MKETILTKDKLPYSLHDMKINKILIEEDNIKFIFENGYVKTNEPFEQIEGIVILKEVDYDYCSVHLLSNNGEYGEFVGRKISLKDFIKEFKQYSFEIVDELYGFHQVQYCGYLSLPNNDNFIECSMDFYYIGDLVYITKE